MQKLRLLTQSILIGMPLMLSVGCSSQGVKPHQPEQILSIHLDNKMTIPEKDKVEIPFLGNIFKRCEISEGEVISTTFPLLANFVSATLYKYVKNWTGLFMPEYTEMEKDDRFRQLESVLPLYIMNVINNDFQFDFGQFYLYIPEGYDSRKKYPMVVFLHGTGPNFKLYFWEWCRVAKEYGYIIVCPSAPLQNEESSKAFLSPLWPSEQGKGFVRDVIKRVKNDYSIDSGRIFIAGLSAGTGGIWTMNVQERRQFAGIISISGVWDKTFASFPEDLKGLNLFVTQAVDDELVSINAGHEIRDTFNKCGSSVKYLEYPDGGHAIFFLKSKDLFPKIFTWMNASR